MMGQAELVERLAQERDLKDEELRLLLEDPGSDALLFQRADEVRREHYGDQVFVRGLIEFTNYCKNDCLYCGIRHGNQAVHRYRLSQEEILECCHEGYELGFRTFVLQGGEDPWYTDERMCAIVRAIKEAHPDCAVTLSLGERSRESYEALFEAGADRYLLRHETADREHYGRLHPAKMSLEHRMECLFWLKEIGYQVGSGFMVGSPWQTTDHLIRDLRFLQELRPHMIGIGPFIRHSQTPLGGYGSGSVELTLRLLAILRLLFPRVLLPATTALGTLHSRGRELGLCAGANVVMPNLSPQRVREDYQLYDNKLSSGAESAQCLRELEELVSKAGYCVVTARGDSLMTGED